jgi:hypothetical protein
MHRYLRAVLLIAALALVATGGMACKSSSKTTAPTATKSTASGTPTKAATGQPTSVSGASTFDSFHYTVDLDFQVNDPNQTQSSLIKGKVEGDFVAPDSHSFTSQFDLAGLSYSEQAVIIDKDAWYKDSSSDWRATTRDDADVQNAISLTSADPGFLQDPEFANNLSALDSQPDTINGVEARRYFIPKGAVQTLSQLLGDSFLQNAAGLQDFQMTVWLENETRGLVRAELTATASPDVFGANAPFNVSPESTVSINMTINLTQINDHSISVEAPI